MYTRCQTCGFGRTWKLADGRLKCRRCRLLFRRPLLVWNRYRLFESDKQKLLEYFVLGVPVFRARFRLPCSRRTAERVRAWPTQTHRQGFRYVVIAKQLEELKRLATPLEAEISRLTAYHDKVMKVQSKWRGKPSSKRTRKDMTPWLVDGRNRALARSQKIRTRVVHVHHYCVNHVDDAREGLIEALVDAAEQFVYAGGPEAIVDEAIAGAHLARELASNAVDLAVDVAETGAQVAAEGIDALQRTWYDLVNESPIDRVFADEGEAGEDAPSHAEVEAFFPDVFDRDDASDEDRDDSNESDDDSNDDDDDDSRDHGADDGDGS